MKNNNVLHIAIQSGTIKKNREVVFIWQRQKCQGFFSDFLIFFFGAVSPYLTRRNPIRFWGSCKLRVPGEIGLRFPISPDPAGAPPAGRHGPEDPGQGKMHHTILFAGLPGRQRCARLSGRRPTPAPNNPDPVPFSPPGKGGHTVSFSASRESPSASRLHPAVPSAVFLPPWRQAASRANCPTAPTRTLSIASSSSSREIPQAVRP